jgi:hypothetical protein
VYNAPADWVVADAAATHGGTDRVEVLVFRLVRPYDPARKIATGRELDGVAARVASQLKGRVVGRGWKVVGGLDARMYSIAFGGKFEWITFVLQGRREYQLLCRRAATADVAPCAELLRSFRET